MCVLLLLLLLLLLLHFIIFVLRFCCFFDHQFDVPLEHTSIAITKIAECVQREHLAAKRECLSAKSALKEPGRLETEKKTSRPVKVQSRDINK